MPIAFVLIHADPGTENRLLKELRTIKSVAEAHFVYGVYDIVVKVEVEPKDKVKEIVTRIRGLDNVRSTLTMTVIGQ
jgi:DNA-binding Lrp family transcriptional regulator